VITVGKIGDPVLAERILEEGKADFVAMARALLADPDLPNKAREGRFDDIRRCIYCNNCLTRNKARNVIGRRFGCTVNPALFREADFQVKRTTSPKRVMVVGGGLAGMEAAMVLAERGHQVSLYECDDKLGGQWNIACLQEGKEGFASLTAYLTRGLDKAGVNINLNKEVTPELVQTLKPQAVVVATGASSASLKVPGIDHKNVVQAIDVITGKASVGNSVVVIGGRYVGMEMALSLAKQRKKVSLVTRHRLGRDVERNTFLTLRQNLLDNGVFVYPDSPVLEITKEGVCLVQDHELLSIKADTVVLAVGSKAENKLAQELEAVIPNVYRIGDCVEPRDAMEAIYEGREVGCKI
jgi:2,4-dienoyl-CoA reductase (NADPH2)